MRITSPGGDETMRIGRKKLRVTLQTKIALLIIAVVGLAVINIGVYLTRWRMAEIKRETETNIINLAKIVANAPIVRDSLDKRNNTGLIQGYVQNILVSTKDIDIIVVVDMNDIRYAHPNAARIGERFVGGDETRVLERGEIYTSEAVGTLGSQIRAFVPVHNDKYEQVGFVMVGRMLENYERTRAETLNIVFFASFVSLIIGVVGAFLLSKSVKNTLLGLEPEEISELYLQRNGMMDAMHEGIIAVDSNFKITLINNSAIKMFGLEGKQVAGRDIRDFSPNSRLGEIMSTGIPEYFKEQIINEDTVVVVNRVPIKEGDRIAGAIATFNDRTTVTRLAEEVTGVRQIVDALRANTHEFMNKLHVILGLIQLGELDEARKFIVDETSKQQNIISLIMGKIKDPTIAGLILGKISRGKELGIDLVIEDDSFLEKRYGRINSSMLVTILGNLIENAMDAVMNNEDGVKRVSVLIKECENNIKIAVEDTGHGIVKKNIPKIFEQGFSTKGIARGTGLYLVREVVELLGGYIEIDSEIDKGTKFVAILPKGGKISDKGINS